MSFTAIVAVDQQGGMGVENRLLCHLPDDLKFFKERTLKKSVIMGRRTYESIGKPLPNRKNIILSRQTGYEAEGCVIMDSIPKCFEYVNKEQGDDEVFIIGGASIFAQTSSYWDKILLTVIDHNFEEADSHFVNFHQYYENKESKGKNDKGWKAKKLLLSHLTDDKHLYSFETYEIDRDERFTKRVSQPIQYLVDLQ